MRKTGRVKIVIALLFLGVLALHCNPSNLPIFQWVTPAQNTVFLADFDVPLPTEVVVAVPQPGCGATVFPIDPATFTATLESWRDGALLSDEDVTASFDAPVLDPTLGKYTFSGTVDLPGFGDWRIVARVSNANGEGAGTLKVQVLQNVANFQGGLYKMTVSNLDQNPNNCLLPDALLPIIKGIVGGTWFPLTFPSAEDILNNSNYYPISIPLPYPLGNVDVTLSVDTAKNAILIDGPDDYTIDLTGLVPPPFTGFDCVITAAANGIFDDLDPWDPDGSLTISISNVQPSPGKTCTLVSPSGSCDLIVDLDASTF
jgi:hypothetical protein